MTKQMMMTAALWTAALLAADPASQQKLQRAIDLMQTKGDLPAAMPLFEDAAKSSDRAVAARALLYLGQCQERQGKERAQATYQRIAKDFGDQREIADRAKARLAALAAPHTATGNGLAARQLWKGPEVDQEGMPSMDGRYVPFVHWESGDLAVKDLATGEQKRLMLKSNWKDSRDYGEWPVLSPDQRELVYAWFDMKDRRYQLRLAANQPNAKARVLVNNSEFTYFQPAGWSADGKAILTTAWQRDGTVQIAWVSTSDGSLKTLRSLEWRSPLTVKLSPDGRYIAYDALERKDSSDRGIFVLAADGRSEQQAVKWPGFNANPVWTPDSGRIAFVSDRSGPQSLWSIAVREGKPEGAPHMLKGDMGDIFPKTFTRSGSLLYYQGINSNNIHAVEIGPDRLGTPKLVSDSYIGRNRAAVWSPDGKSVAYLSRRGPVENVPGAYALVVRSLASGQERAFVLNVNIAYGQGPIWSHDGKWILIRSRDPLLGNSLYRLELESGQMTKLPTRPTGVNRPIQALAPDDRTLYLVKNPQDDSLPNLVSFDLESGKESVLYTVPARAYLSNMAMSRDGRYFATILVKSDGNRELLTMDSTGQNVRSLLRTGSEEPGAIYNGLGVLEWSPDGKFLYLVRLRANTKKKEIHRMSPTDSDSTPMGFVADELRFMSIDPGGTRLVYTSGGQGSAELWSLDNVLPAVKAAR